MYNLFVSNDQEAWDGEPWLMDAGRCVREYTDDVISERLRRFDADSVANLRSFPCIFAYENGNNLAPKFGAIRDVVERQGAIRVEYVIHNVEPFLTHEDLDRLRFELDIGRWELNRTHWAVKDVNLPRELIRHDIRLPDWARGALVDIERHQFEVGLSFPGEARDFVEAVAAGLEGHLGPDSYFYDNNYIAQLARPGLDDLLQDIYRNRSKMIVVLIGGDYQATQWCGVEWRAIRNIINDREHARVMFVRMDDGDVDGVLPNDGYVDARRFSAAEVARFISQRVGLIP